MQLSRNKWEAGTTQTFYQLTWKKTKAISHFLASSEQESLGSRGTETASCISGLPSVQSCSKCHGYSPAVLDLRIFQYILALRNLGTKTWTERTNISEIRVCLKLSSLCLETSESVRLKINEKTSGAPAETYKISKLIKIRHLVVSLYYYLHVHTL